MNTSIQHNFKPWTCLANTSLQGYLFDRSTGIVDNTEVELGE
jgi:hypothetical protein